VAHVLVGKYADHLPLCRHSQIYARQGIELDRSTLADWVGRAAAELRPVHERLFEHLKRSPKLFMDETRAPVLDPGRKPTKSGYLWAIARDDRPWGGTDAPAVAYLYGPGRGAEHAIRPLAGFNGVLQVDAYAAYKALAEPGRAGGPVMLAYCWSHVRCRFYEIAPGRQRSDRRGSLASDQCPLPRRGDDPRPCARTATSRPPGAEQARGR
jgi:transposase